MTQVLFNTHADGLAPLQKRTKRDHLVQKLLEMIYQGQLRDGDSLPAERELSGMFAVSRETVRGALSVLSSWGLLSVSQGAKTRVLRTEAQLQLCAQLMPELSTLDICNYTIESVFESRMVVETNIARLAANRIDKRGRDSLTKLLDQQAKLLDEKIHFQLADKYFHEKIADIAGNPILGRYAQELYSYGLYFRREVLEGQCKVDESYAEHVKLTEAICSGDGDLAAETMLIHLRSVLSLSKTAR
ncbi:FadR/GntR family transcriptional regulator [Simiduia litorea]|uniref:FadR/GntR family transcriptional regulator n=1 Tax=Simiduia litorea TaxID=1435348 RepID=UPI0036F2BE65